MVMAATRKKSKPKKRVTKAETAMRKRGSEALGFLLILIGVAFVALIWSYNPSDPSFSSATDAAPQNMLGSIGAWIADPLHKALGWAAYGIPVSLLVWGVRLLTSRGQERAMKRAIFTPLSIALTSFFLSVHTPFETWASSYIYGLGGIFGDTIFEKIWRILPVNNDLNLVILTLVLAAISIPFSAFTLGINLVEFRAFLRWIWNGFVTVYHGAKWALVKFSNVLYAILAALGLKGLQAARNAREAGKQRAADAAERKASGDVAISRNDVIDAEPAPASAGISNRLSAKISAAVTARKTAKAERADDIPMYGKPSGEERAEPPLQSAPKETPEPVVPRVQHPTPKKATKSVQARKEEQPSLALEPSGDGYETPPISFLENPTKIVRHTLSDEALNENARMLENVLDDYGVKGEIVAVRPGPVVTMYELEPSAGLKASRVIGLADDIARSMSALAARVSTIPGRSVIGIELPNANREMVLFREIISNSVYGDSKFKLPLALGKDIGGDPIVADLARMPHLLIAGTTGSGKSVGINTMILSLLYTLSPQECRMIMVDPKMLELSVYDGIPHLLSPVVTDPKKAVVALKWAVAEMEDRYRKMSKMGVRNIDGYNGRVADALAKGEGFTRTTQTGFDDLTGEPVFETEEYMPEKMPFIVIVVDEMADLMMVAGKEIEACIMRLAQMARASGIHLIMATQRPSVDVITGTIKANFPTRISFQVTSKIDSRTILGEMGAEQLLGMGDMLYMEGGGKVTRVHGPFVSDEEVEEIVKFLKAQGEPEYVSGVVEGPEGEAEANVDALLGLGGNTDGENALYDQAVQIVARDRKCSTSYIQRKLSIGYNKAAKLVEEMEDNGVVSAANHVGKREILIPEVQ